MSEKGPLCALYVRKCVKYNKKKSAFTFVNYKITVVIYK